MTRAAPGEWSPAALGWGPLYEPHRHPAGAELGRRLRLPPGRYLLELAAEGLAPEAAPAVLDVVPDRPGAPVRVAPLRGRTRRFRGVVRGPADGARGRLAAAGGRPHPLEGAMRLTRPTFRRLSGLTLRRRSSMRMFSTGIATLAVAGAALVATAQPGAGRGRGRHGEGPNPAVLKQELGLSDEQSAQLQKLWQEERKQAIRRRADMEIARMELEQALERRDGRREARRPRRSRRSRSCRPPRSRPGWTSGSRSRSC